MSGIGLMCNDVHLLNTAFSNKSVTHSRKKRALRRFLRLKSGTRWLGGMSLMSEMTPLIEMARRLDIFSEFPKICSSNPTMRQDSRYSSLWQMVDRELWTAEN